MAAGFTSGNALSSGPGWGCCLGHQPSPVQWPPFHAGQIAGTLPAGGAGSAGAPPVGGSGNASRSESVPASPCGGSPSPSLSPSALVTSCASSSVGDRGRVLRGAAGSAIAVSLCLRAGGGVRMSRGWCVGALVRCSVWGWWMGIPGGGRFPALRGASGVRRCPSPGRPTSGAGSQGSATRVSRVRSMLACGPSTGPTACTLAGRRCSLWGWRKGVPGGSPSIVVRGAWCQALSLPRPPVIWSGQPGFRDPCVPGAVDVGVWTQHRPHSVRPCRPALLAVGVAEGRPRGGRLPPL